MKAAGTRSDLAGMDELRRASPSHQTLNFSKVEPRIHFPKRGYKPPKGRKSLERARMSPQPPIVFKSPADIVQEVLFSIDRSSPCDTDRPTKAASYTVPPEFRCRQQATSLVKQLQEDYDRLLTKYAEAENTIDRLRLGAKVNLNSEPPKAGHAVPAGLNQTASKLLKMDLCYPHRAVTSSPGQATHQEKLDASSLPSDFGQLSNILFTQSEKFIQQVQTFEDLLKNDKLASLEELKCGVSQLYEGLNFLERGYLLARDEHKLLQQKGLGTQHFDPERTLENLIFQCGLRTEDLKEQVEQVQLNLTEHQEPIQLESVQQKQIEQVELIQLESVQQKQIEHQEPIQLESVQQKQIEHQEPIQLESVQQKQIEHQEPIQLEKVQQQEPNQLNPIEHQEAILLVQQEQIQQNQIQQQKQLQQEVQQHKAVASCCSSPSLATSCDPSEGEETQTQPQRLSSQTGFGSAAKLEINSACNKSEEEEDAAEDDIMSLYLRSLSRRGKYDKFEQSDSLDYCQKLKERFLDPKPLSSLPSNSPPRHGEEKKEQKGWRNGNGNVQETFAQSRKVESDVDSLCRSKTNLPSCSPPSTPTTTSAPSRKRMEWSTSLGSACCLADWRNCKVQTGRRRVLSQDRISVETDSGFMGSENSHQIPGAVPLHPHQMATESVSAPQDRSSQLDAGPRDGTEPQPRPRRSRQRRSTFSPQSFISQRKEARADARPSDLWKLFYSNTSDDENLLAHLPFEEQQSTHSTAGLLSSSPPGACCRHGNAPRAQSSSSEREESPIDAFLLLQAKVDHLKEKLDISLRNEKPPSSAKIEKLLGAATTSAQETFWRCSSPISDDGLERSLFQILDDIEPETLFSKTARETKDAAAPKQQQNHFLCGSELDQLRAQVSRSTQSSLTPSKVSSNVRSRNIQTWMSSTPDAADKPDSEDQRCLCPQCTSVLRQPACPPGGSREPLESLCWCRCSICGLLKLHKSTDSDCYRYFPPTHKNHQPGSSDRAFSRRFSRSVSPSPLYQQQLLLPSKPQYSFADASPGHGSGLRRPRERKSRSLHVVEGQTSLNDSLDRAICAARCMKYTSSNMAHSLASSLVYQKQLTQSCYY